MFLTELYKNRLKVLAGIDEGGIDNDGIEIINEITDSERNQIFAVSDKRVPFSKDLMSAAIKEGREILLLFQSNNDKYKMPVAKYRICYPVAMGLSKKGNLVIRCWHVFGQSESKALETGIRSAEASGEWRLLKTSNIKGIAFTGRFFRTKPSNYNPRDKSMVSVQISTNFNEVKKIQDRLFVQAQKNKQVR